MQVSVHMRSEGMLGPAPPTAGQGNGNEWVLDSIQTKCEMDQIQQTCQKNGL